MTAYLYPQGKLLVEEMIDPVKMKDQLQKTLPFLESEIKRATLMLANPRFLEKAPKDKILEEKNKLELFEKQLREAKEKLKLLG
jgi:valyl-tRNA synthetase